MLLPPFMTQMPNVTHTAILSIGKTRDEMCLGCWKGKIKLSYSISQNLDELLPQHMLSKCLRSQQSLNHYNLYKFAHQVEERRMSVPETRNNDHLLGDGVDDNDDNKGTMMTQPRLSLAQHAKEPCRHQDSPNIIR